MATRPSKPRPTAANRQRGKIVDALWISQRKGVFEDISVRDISKAAGVLSRPISATPFHSGGAVLAGLSRRIDRAVLAQDQSESLRMKIRASDTDVLMRRLEAMALYREGLREVTARLRARARRCFGDEPGGDVLDALHARGGGHRGGGAAGAIKLQGLAFAWARVLRVWPRR